MAYGYEIYAGEVPSWADQLPAATEEINEHHLHEFFRTMHERQEVWYKRFMLQKPQPWTSDKYLANHKFTNVYRELDRASQWLIKNVLSNHNLSLKDLLFKLIIFRFYNQPNTFDNNIHFVNLPDYDTFDAKKIWRETVTYRMCVDNPWHTAYLMNLAFVKKPKDWKGEGLFKDEAYCTVAFPKIHALIPELIKVLSTAKKPEEIIKCLQKMPAVATFQAHEFYIDFCYVAKYWKKAIMPFDQNSFTNVGPGASLGLRLIFPSLEAKNQISGIYTLRDLAESYLAGYFPDFKFLEWNSAAKVYVVDRGGFMNGCNITLHQVEMWLCEYQKYWKMTIQQGKQRSKFVPFTKQM